MNALIRATFVIAALLFAAACAPKPWKNMSPAQMEASNAEAMRIKRETGWTSTPGLPPPASTMVGIFVETDPPGARIEVNNGYEGIAPLKISVPARPDGTWAENTKVTASPVLPGQQVQTKFFWQFDHHKIPKRIFFDMNLVRPRPSIDVNLNNGEDDE